MRFVFGTTNVTTAKTAVQPLNDSMGRVLEFIFKARVGNGVKMFLGNSSVSSAIDGVSISSTGTFPPSGTPFTVPAGKGFAPSTFWVNASTSTTDKLDWGMLVEP